MKKKKKKRKIRIKISIIWLFIQTGKPVVLSYKAFPVQV